MNQLARDLVSLTKPRLSSLVLITTACGILLAQGSPLAPSLELAEGAGSHTPVAFLGLWPALLTLLGTACVVAAANAINCLMEKDVDAYMTRTRERPLVTGRLSVRWATLFSVALSVAALVLLWIGSNPLTTLLGLVGLLLYTIVYTPLKRRSMSAVFAGAIPGAIPPMMGWTAVTGHLALGAWILFGILFFWQLPHFIAISMFRQKEYDNAGLKTVPGTLGADAAGQHMLAYSTMLVGVSLLPYSQGLAGQSYFMTSLALGILFTSFCLAGVLKIKDLNWPRVVFFGSLAYLPLVLGTWVLEKWLIERSL